MRAFGEDAGAACVPDSPWQRTYRRGTCRRCAGVWSLMALKSSMVKGMSNSRAMASRWRTALSAASGGAGGDVGVLDGGAG